LFISTNECKGSDGAIGNYSRSGCFDFHSPVSRARFRHHCIAIRIYSNVIGSSVCT